MKNYLSKGLLVVSMVASLSLQAGGEQPTFFPTQLEKPKHPVMAFLEKHWKYLCIGGAAVGSIAGFVWLGHRNHWFSSGTGDSSTGDSSTGGSDDADFRLSGIPTESGQFVMDETTIPECVKSNLVGNFKKELLPIHGQTPNLVAKSLIDQLDSSAWASNLRSIKDNPFKDDATIDRSKKITISVGGNNVKISLSRLQELVSQTELVVDGTLVTLENFKTNVGKSSSGIFGPGVCHVTPVIFFVDQDKIDSSGDAHSKIRTDNLDKAKPVTLLSTPGFTSNDFTRKQAQTFWRVQLAGAKAKNIAKIFSPATSLGTFGGDPKKAGKIYQSLCDVLKEGQFKDMKIFLHPLEFGPQLKWALDKNPEVKGQLFGFDRNVMLEAIELSKKGEDVALINPSNDSVVAGTMPVGNDFTGRTELNFPAEQYFASVSSASLASFSVVPHLWKSKVRTVKQVG